MNSRIKTQDGQIVCERCGVVIMDSDPYDIPTADEARASANDSTYLGNGLLVSQTTQNGYVSRSNPGVAFILSGTQGRDFQGKKTKRQIQGDGYRAGNIIDKGTIVKVDSVTGESELKFSLVDSPYFPYLKQKANIALSRSDLSNVDRSIVEIFLKQVCQSLVLGPIAEFCWQAAAINSGLLKPEEAKEVEQKMYSTIRTIRDLLLSHCDRKLAAKMREDQKARQPQPEESLKVA